MPLLPISDGSSFSPDWSALLLRNGAMPKTVLVSLAPEGVTKYVIEGLVPTRYQTFFSAAFPAVLPGPVSASFT
jgi:hypothetical protein